MAITTSSVLPAAVQQTMNNRLLSTPVANHIYRIPASRYNMPRNGGRFLRMRRYNPLDAFTVPLGNTGITPPAQVLTSVDIDAEIQFYGKGAVIVEA